MLDLEYVQLNVTKVLALFNKASFVDISRRTILTFRSSRSGGKTLGSLDHAPTSLMPHVQVLIHIDVRSVPVLSVSCSLL